MPGLTLIPQTLRPACLLRRRYCIDPAIGALSSLVAHSIDSGKSQRATRRKAPHAALDVETVLTCPAWIRDSIARAAADIEAATSGAAAPVSLGVEAAHIIGALTEAEELAHAVLARPALSPAGLGVEKLARLVSPEAARTAAALQDLGELSLPRDWSASQGLGPQQAETVRKMLLAVAERSQARARAPRRASGAAAPRIRARRERARASRA